MDIFDALADPTRRSILQMLASRGEMSATEISEQFKVSPPAVSQHLKVLREAELVHMEKRAQRRIYTINPQGIHEVEEWTRQVIEMWNRRFDALDKLLQEQKKGLTQSQTGKDD
jgi:DNA-binding transcriptional ArsR family regulator